MTSSPLSSSRPESAAVRVPRGAAVLDPAITEAILDAALDGLASRGFAAMSMDGIARQAGVGKSAIYRRWPSKEQLTGEVIAGFGVRSRDDLPDTGSLRGDIRFILDEMVAWFGDARTGPAFTDLLAEAVRNPILAEVMMTGFAEPRRKRVGFILDRAERRGELSEHADRALLLDLVAAPVFWRLIAQRGAAPPSFLESIAHLIASEASAPNSVTGRGNDRRY